MAGQERWTGRAGNMQWRGVVQAWRMCEKECRMEEVKHYSS
jgi:hypothetical protein